jgi:hypothetical protein
MPRHPGHRAVGGPTLGRAVPTNHGADANATLLPYRYYGTAGSAPYPALPIAYPEASIFSQAQ